MAWNWQDEGFSSPPRLLQAPPGLLLYRAWGGNSSKTGTPARPGVCLSTQRPNSRTQADRLFSAWEWGNSCLWLTVFRIAPGTDLHVGLVDLAEVFDLRLVSGRGGVQVLVENPIVGKLFETESKRLTDELGGLQIGAGSKTWN